MYLERGARELGELPLALESECWKKAFGEPKKDNSNVAAKSKTALQDPKHVVLCGLHLLPVCCSSLWEELVKLQILIQTTTPTWSRCSTIKSLFKEWFKISRS